MNNYSKNKKIDKSLNSANMYIQTYYAEQVNLHSMAKNTHTHRINPHSMSRMCPSKVIRSVNVS
jgi:hypothetical protein